MKFELAEAMAVLERTPVVLRQLLQGLSEPWIQNNEGPDTWSPFDVVGHLLHGEETDWIPRMRILMEEGGNRTFTPFDRFAQFEKSKGKRMDDLLDAFETARRENLRIVRGLEIRQDDLSRTAIHPALGTVTLSELLASWAVHDLGHIAQIARVMARQWTREVGPWVEYMSVLKERAK